MMRGHRGPGAITALIAQVLKNKRKLCCLFVLLCVNFRCVYVFLLYHGLRGSALGAPVHVNVEATCCFNLGVENKNQMELFPRSHVDISEKREKTIG